MRVMNGESADVCGKASIELFDDEIPYSPENELVYVEDGERRMKIVHGDATQLKDHQARMAVDAYFKSLGAPENER